MILGDDKKVSTHKSLFAIDLLGDFYSAKYTNYFMYIGYCKEKEKLIGGETFSTNIYVK